MGTLKILKAYTITTAIAIIIGMAFMGFYLIENNSLEMSQGISVPTITFEKEEIIEKVFVTLSGIN